MGLDDPAKKMSKSAESAYNYIALTDSPDEIRRKIRRAVTDSGTDVRTDPDKPALTNLLTIYSMLADEPVEAVVARYEGKGYAEFKTDLAEVVVEALAPFQRRMAELGADKGFTSTCCATAPSAPRRSPSAPWRRCASAWGSCPGHKAAAAAPPADRAPRKPSSETCSTPACSRRTLLSAWQRRAAARRCHAPAREAPRRVELVQQAARMGRPAVVVGGEGAGRFGPPPPRPPRQGQQGHKRRQELARVGTREGAPQHQVFIAERHGGTARSRCPGGGRRLLDRQAERTAPVQGSSTTRRPGRAAAASAAARLTASWSGWPPS